MPTIQELGPENNRSQLLSQALGQLSGGFAGTKYQKHVQEQERQAEKSRLQQAIAQAKNNPNLTNEQKGILDLYEAFSGNPAAAKQIQSDFAEQLKNQNTAAAAAQKSADYNARTNVLANKPVGGPTNQPLSPEAATKIEEVVNSNKNSNADELALAFDKAGIPRTQSNSYIENRRRQDESAAKRSENIGSEKRKETAKIREDIATKALAAQESIKNKQNALDIIDRNQLTDPTVAAFLDSLPFNYGKRFLSPDTVEYKAGLVDEFKDLRNIFTGQTRVAELNILEQKIADTYLTDDQKKRVLKARINALDADVIRGEVAAEMEAEGKDLGVGEFTRELNRRVAERTKVLADQTIDEMQAVFNEADIKKKRKLDFNNPDDYEIGRQILKEAGGDKNKARQIGKKKGYSW